MATPYLFNFPTDRARQLPGHWRFPALREFDVSGRPQIDFVCFTVYDLSFPYQLPLLRTNHKKRCWRKFGKDSVRNYRLAETEKYAHVTYFFNGGVEKEHACERRLLVPSPRIATYDPQPEMSAFKVTDKVLRDIDEGRDRHVIINTPTRTWWAIHWVNST